MKIVIIGSGMMGSARNLPLHAKCWRALRLNQLRLLNCSAGISAVKYPNIR